MPKSINFKVSVVIPTWNRKLKLIECIDSLVNQDFVPLKYEILVCDSESLDGTNEDLKKYIKKNNLNMIKIFQCKFNNTALKRNTGIKNSSFPNIILLDDDCIPFKDFFNIYFTLLDNDDPYKIFCGEYRIRNELLKSNYSKYRDSRYFGSNKWNIKKDIFLDFHSIVTGNMAFKKDLIVSNSIFFNEGMVGYGLQDIEWGWNLKQNNMQLIKCDAKVFHDETSGDIIEYRKKVFYVAKDAMANLKKVNLEAAKDYKYYFLEKEYRFNFKRIICIALFNLLFEKTLMKALELWIYKTDRMPIFYAPILYKILILSSWIKGVNSRKEVFLTDKDTKTGWYAKGKK